MGWGMDTNFQKVFDKILKVAVEGKFEAGTDDKELLNNGKQIIRRFVRKYTEKGYGSAVPQIVFWNLRHSTATPVPGNQKGVVLLSGFSKNLLKLFFDSKLDMDIGAEIAMEAAISGEEYQKLVAD
ncbi:hypothetical protein Dsin_010778 [Dipteronia sinensis]|uniref:DUF7788 domain-containing protein n=1 Tax=Dipteronia sinensis TaxID=43782 RepID=A0AAE0AT62_9ROSI|nr:hypothetical protein Dsin_010778 [Dipteronia sinensis]